MNKLLLLYCLVFAGACTTRNTSPKHITAHAVDSSNWPSSFGFGHRASAAAIAKLDIDIRPDGKGLPAGEGNAVTGKVIYINKCMAWHVMAARVYRQVLNYPNHH